MDMLMTFLHLNSIKAGRLMDVTLFSVLVALPPVSGKQRASRKHLVATKNLSAVKAVIWSHYFFIGFPAVMRRREEATLECVQRGSPGNRGRSTVSLEAVVGPTMPKVWLFTRSFTDTNSMCIWEGLNHDGRICTGCDAMARKGS